MMISSRVDANRAVRRELDLDRPRDARRGRRPPLLIVGMAALGFLVLADVSASIASEDARASDSTAPAAAATTWKLARKSTDDEIVVFVEKEPQPGRPAFRLETALEVPPRVAADTLMESMAEEGSASMGERRRLLERRGGMALVHTFIDLPFMFADRELAVRIEHSVDRATGTHRIEWRDENERLPPPEDGVLRLASQGFWEFRPMGPSGTQAVYVTRAEVGGSLPSAIGDRLMRKQAIDAVERLQRLVARHGRVQVAAPPPAGALP